MESWHVHFQGRGTTRTLAPEGMMEVEATILATLHNAKFTASVGVHDHREAVDAIVLTEGQQGLIRRGVVTSDGVGSGSKSWLVRPTPGPPPCIGLTRIDAIGKRLCDSRDEEAFVTAVLLHVEHELSATKDGRVRMTDAQVQEIAARRFDGIKWGPQQVERLKSKYLARPVDGKPTTRFELMRELAKGSRRTGQAAGTPSEYLPTGLLALLSAGGNMGFAAGVAAAAGEAAA
ncbi:hypothetical protein [Singulisphaera sp. PoT]|uniref:hypothetical protein n=1 Tax=Singulisphaera sp. PoT TaxID=3411797 RepID=UPI003BF5583F